MRSTLYESPNPALDAASTARDTAETSCSRPSAPRTCGTIDCTPKERRVTPASRYPLSLAASTVSGLHSTVTSCSRHGEINKALPQANVGDIAGPNVVGSIDLETAQQIRIDLVP